jgi:hypothetical protein
MTRPGPTCSTILFLDSLKSIKNNMLDSSTETANSGSGILEMSNEGLIFMQLQSVKQPLTDVVDYPLPWVFASKRSMC